MKPNKTAALPPCSPATTETGPDSPDSRGVLGGYVSPRTQTATTTPENNKTNPRSITELLEDIEYFDGAFGTDDCGYRPEVMKLVFALRIAVNHLNWLIAKGIVMSAPSSLTPECLEKIRKTLE